MSISQNRIPNDISSCAATHQLVACDDVQRYVAEHSVLINPLVYDGFPSIGCAPCTRRVAPGDDPRSGRWAGTGKTECGIHS